MKENSPVERLFNGIIKENPTLVIILGMCPTMAITTSAMNGIGMGLSTTVVLALSNMAISALRNIIPSKIHIPAYIVIIATFVTIIDMLMNGFTPALYSQLGIYIPLIVVNCIILGRAEAYAYNHKPVASFFDGLGMGLGFTCSITIIGFIRELIGAGSIFGHSLGISDYTPTIFVMAPGAFFVLATIIAIRTKIINNMEEKKGRKLEVRHTDNDGGENCSECSFCGACSGKFYAADTISKTETADADDKDDAAAGKDGADK